MADDFISDGRPIVAVRWWGSYLQTAPSEPPVGFVVPFDISFHQSTGTHPNSLPVAQPMAMYSVLAQEHYTGYLDMAGHPVFEYNAYLDPWFPEVAGQEYFLDIFRAAEILWGWHDAGPAGSGHPIMDWAAMFPMYAGPWQTYLLAGNPPAPGTDLAFELMTVPEPGTWLLLGAGLLCAAIARHRR
jgi:PEP-CTERM motif